MPLILKLAGGMIILSLSIATAEWFIERKKTK